MSEWICSNLQPSSIWIGHCGADCDNASQWFTTTPRNEGTARRTLSVLVNQPDQLAPLWNSRCTSLHWKRDWHTRLGRDVSSLGSEHVCTRNYACTWHQLNWYTDRSVDLPSSEPSLSATAMRTVSLSSQKARKQWSATAEASRHSGVLPGDVCDRTARFESRLLRWDRPKELVCPMTTALTPACADAV